MIRYLEPREVPDILKKVFGDYKGRKFEVKEATQVTIESTWSGGSRSYWKAVNLITGEIFSVEKEWGNIFVDGRRPTVDIPPNTAIAEHIIFCGKDHGICFYLRAENITSLISSTTELAWAEKVVLSATRSLKSSYAGQSNYRLCEAKRTVGISEETFTNARNKLVEKKMLDKRGAITVAGKNVIGFTNLWELKK